jgi:predicted Zn-dependent peptidase
MQQARAFYDTYYAPNNLTGVLVGNFDPAEVRTLAQRYFGRLERGERPPADVVTLEMPQIDEKRMLAECDCQPQTKIAYHTVAFRHRDSYALDVLAALLSGRTGRLYKSLVLDQQIASEVSATQESQKYGGGFSVTVEAKGDATPADLEAAWYRELERIRSEPIPEEELQKVKNQIQADAFRRLDSTFFLLIQLLYYDGLGDWNYLNDWAGYTLSVTEEDVQRVATEYFQPQNRLVSHYHRKAGTAAEPVPPELEGLPADARQMVMGQVRQIRAMDDADELRGIAAQIDGQRAQVPEPMRPAMDYVAAAIQERLAELEAETEGGE